MYTVMCIKWMTNKKINKLKKERKRKENQPLISKSEKDKYYMISLTWGI